MTRSVLGDALKAVEMHSEPDREGSSCKTREGLGGLFSVWSGFKSQLMLFMCCIQLVQN